MASLVNLGNDPGSATPSFTEASTSAGSWIDKPVSVGAFDPAVLLHKTYRLITLGF